MEKDIMMSVILVTYNHERFVKDAIESVINQKVNFRYEVIIHDDDSTDGTPEIIKEYEKKYPELIKLILETENQFQKGKLYETLFHIKRAGKYFAFLEGDDYWTDSEKLQKQIDFLEAHDQYSMCMHNAVQLNCVTGETKLLNTFPGDGTYSQEEQVLAGLGTNFPAAASFVFRTSFLKNMPEFFLEAPVADYPYRQYFANCGKVYYFEKPMSVYRTSVPHSYVTNVRGDQDFYKNYTLGMIQFFEKFNVYTEHRFHDILERKIISDYLGFCTAIDEKHGLEQATEAELDLDKIKSCYKCISADYLDESIRLLCRKTDHLFIYGTSRMGTVCENQLIRAGIKFDGFVVSDGQMKPQKVDDKDVYYLSDVLEKYENPGFILAIQPVNESVIVDTLQRHHVKNYCKPYTLES